MQGGGRVFGAGVQAPFEIQVLLSGRALSLSGSHSLARGEDRAGDSEQGVTCDTATVHVGGHPGRDEGSQGAADTRTEA